MSYARVSGGVDPARMRTDSVPVPPRAAGVTAWVTAAAWQLGRPAAWARHGKLRIGLRDVAQLG